MQQSSAGTMTRPFGPFAARTTTVEPRLVTHWTRSLHVDLHARRHLRILRRIGLAFAVICFVFAVSEVAYLEASILGRVPSPEMAAASIVTGRVPPPPQATDA